MPHEGNLASCPFSSGRTFLQGNESVYPFSNRLGRPPLFFVFPDYPPPGLTKGNLTQVRVSEGCGQQSPFSAGPTERAFLLPGWHAFPFQSTLYPSSRPFLDRDKTASPAPFPPCSREWLFPDGVPSVFPPHPAWWDSRFPRLHRDSCVLTGPRAVRPSGTVWKVAPHYLFLPLASSSFSQARISLFPGTR